MEARIWALIAEGALRRAAPASALDVCAACAGTMSVSGAGLALVAGGRLEPCHVVGDLDGELLEADLAVGGGPCAEAALSGGPVLVPELPAGVHATRWPAFAAPAHAVGVRAVFAFPLVTGAVKVGVLVLCRDRPGPLGAHEEAESPVFADAAMALLLGERTRVADQGALPVGSLDLGAEVHQAAGMVSVQLGSTLEEALLRMRSHAFTYGVPLGQVARQVVGGGLRFG